MRRCFPPYAPGLAHDLIAHKLNPYAPQAMGAPLAPENGADHNPYINSLCTPAAPPDLIPFQDFHPQRERGPQPNPISRLELYPP